MPRILANSSGESVGAGVPPDCGARSLRGDEAVLATASRHVDGIEDVAQQRIGVEVLRLRLVGEQHAVTQHVGTDRLHVLRRDVGRVPP